MMRRWTGMLALLAFGLASCGGVTRIHNPAADQAWPPQADPVPLDQGTKATPKNVAIFFDGTGNDLNTTTNVARLYQLTINQNRRDIAAFYTSGVGADRTGPVGLATGLGFRADVQAAYRFLVENYAGPRDKIHLYGYSRGAFSARALAGLVHTVGLVDLKPDMDPATRDQLIDDLFTAYKFSRKMPRAQTCPVRHGQPQEAIDIRRCATAQVLRDYGVTARHSHDKVRFAMVGLWDTVETLGLTNGRDDPDHYNWRYSDQICNMDKVAHAVSLHDNRAGSYTPVLMTRRRLVADCESQSLTQFNRVNEVWFAGDHGQIGGTEALGYLSGVSMNWMLEQARGVGVNGPIFPKGAQVYADRFDFVKDAERQNPAFRVLFGRQLRGIGCYAQPGAPGQWRTGSAVDGIKIHSSVKDRLNAPVRSLRRDRDGTATPGLDVPTQEAQVTTLGAPTAECSGVAVTYVNG